MKKKQLDATVQLSTPTPTRSVFSLLSCCTRWAIKRTTLVWAVHVTLVFFDEFLQRVSIACYAERCISYDRFCPTVRPSVCHTLQGYHAKTTPATIMGSSLEDSPMTLVY